jgi:hypothetical protein
VIIETNGIDVPSIGIAGGEEEIMREAHRIG